MVATLRSSWIQALWVIQDTVNSAGKGPWGKAPKGSLGGGAAKAFKPRPCL